MTDEIIPIANVQSLCPQCGAKLLIEQLGTEPEPHDRVLCPEHGLIGTCEEIHAQVYEQYRNEIMEHAKDHVSQLVAQLRRGILLYNHLPPLMF